MPKTTYTVTAPTGEVLTRTSQNRIYTHAIIGRHSYEAAMQRANRISAVDKDNHDFYVEMANETHRLAERREWHTVEQHAAEIAKYKTLAAQAPNRDAYAELQRSIRVQAVEALKKSGFYERFVAMTWCGRPDLAQKELGKYSSAGSYVDVQAVPVTIKGKG